MARSISSIIIDLGGWTWHGIYYSASCHVPNVGTRGRVRCLGSREKKFRGAANERQRIIDVKATTDPLNSVYD